jgi:hypothetical protein
VLTGQDRRRLAQNAYIPEHLPAYIETAADGEPHLIDDYLVLAAGRRLTFIGYPLSPEAPEPAEALMRAAGRFDAEAALAMFPGVLDLAEDSQEDWYYLLKLPAGSGASGRKYMVRRALREAAVGPAAWNQEHQALARDFARRLPAPQQSIYSRIGRYLEASRSAAALEARSRSGRLEAALVMDLGEGERAFWMFSLRRPDSPPGTTDLLFYEMVRRAEERGKRSINLGLGINPGVAGFKTSWGGRPFLKYEAAEIPLQKKSPFRRMVEGFLRGGTGFR